MPISFRSVNGVIIKLTAQINPFGNFLGTVQAQSLMGVNLTTCLLTYTQWIKDSCLNQGLVLEHVLINVKGVKLRQKLFDQHVKNNIVSQGKSPDVWCVIVVVKYLLSLHIEHIYFGLIEVKLVFGGNELSFPVIKVPNIASVALSEAEVIVAECVLVLKRLVVKRAVSALVIHVRLELVDHRGWR